MDTTQQVRPCGCVLLGVLGRLSHQGRRHAYYELPRLSDDIGTIHKDVILGRSDPGCMVACVKGRMLGSLRARRKEWLAACQWNASCPLCRRTQQLLESGGGGSEGAMVLQFRVRLSAMLQAAVRSGCMVEYVQGFNLVASHLLLTEPSPASALTSFLSLFRVDTPGVLHALASPALWFSKSMHGYEHITALMQLLSVFLTAVSTSSSTQVTQIYQDTRSRPPVDPDEVTSGPQDSQYAALAFLSRLLLIVTPAATRRYSAVTHMLPLALPKLVLSMFVTSFTDASTLNAVWRFVRSASASSRPPRTTATTTGSGAGRRDSTDEVMRQLVRSNHFGLSPPATDSHDASGASSFSQKKSPMVLVGRLAGLVEGTPLLRCVRVLCALFVVFLDRVMLEDIAITVTSARPAPPPSQQASPRSIKNTIKRWMGRRKQKQRQQARQRHGLGPVVDEDVGEEVDEQKWLSEDHGDSMDREVLSIELCKEFLSCVHDTEHYQFKSALIRSYDLISAKEMTMLSAALSLVTAHVRCSIQARPGTLPSIDQFLNPGDSREGTGGLGLGEAKQGKEGFGGHDDIDSQGISDTGDQQPPSQSIGPDAIAFYSVVLHLHGWYSNTGAFAQQRQRIATAVDSLPRDPGPLPPTADTLEKLPSSAPRVPATQVRPAGAPAPCGDHFSRAEVLWLSAALQGCTLKARHGTSRPLLGARLVQAFLHRVYSEGGGGGGGMLCVSPHVPLFGVTLSQFTRFVGQSRPSWAHCFQYPRPIGGDKMGENPSSGPVKSGGLATQSDKEWLASRMFRVLDLDHDGILSSLDLLKYLQVTYRGSAEERMMMCFRVLDTGRKGYLDAWDLQRFVAGCMNTLMAQHQEPSVGGAARELLQRALHQMDSLQNPFTSEPSSEFASTLHKRMQAHRDKHDREAKQSDPASPQCARRFSAAERVYLTGYFRGALTSLQQHGCVLPSGASLFIRGEDGNECKEHRSEQRSGGPTAALRRLAGQWRGGVAAVRVPRGMRQCMFGKSVQGSDTHGDTNVGKACVCARADLLCADDRQDTMVFSEYTSVFSEEECPNDALDSIVPCEWCSPPTQEDQTFSTHSTSAQSLVMQLPSTVMSYLNGIRQTSLGFLREQARRLTAKRSGSHHYGRWDPRGWVWGASAPAASALGTQSGVEMVETKGASGQSAAQSKKKKRSQGSGWTGQWDFLKGGFRHVHRVLWSRRNTSGSGDLDRGTANFLSQATVILLPTFLRFPFVSRMSLRLVGELGYQLQSAFQDQSDTTTGASSTGSNRAKSAVALQDIELAPYDVRMRTSDASSHGVSPPPPPPRPPRSASSNPFADDEESHSDGGNPFSSTGDNPFESPSEAPQSSIPLDRSRDGTGTSGSHRQAQTTHSTRRTSHTSTGQSVQTQVLADVGNVDNRTSSVFSPTLESDRQRESAEAQSARVAAGVDVYMEASKAHNDATRVVWGWRSVVPHGRRISWEDEDVQRARAVFHKLLGREKMLTLALLAGSALQLFAVLHSHVMRAAWKTMSDAQAPLCSTHPARVRCRCGRGDIDEVKGSEHKEGSSGDECSFCAHQCSLACQSLSMPCPRVMLSLHDFRQLVLQDPLIRACFVFDAAPPPRRLDKPRALNGTHSTDSASGPLSDPLWAAISALRQATSTQPSRDQPPSQPQGDASEDTDGWVVEGEEEAGVQEGTSNPFLKLGGGSGASARQPDSNPFVSHDSSDTGATGSNTSPLSGEKHSGPLTPNAPPSPLSFAEWAQRYAAEVGQWVSHRQRAAKRPRARCKPQKVRSEPSSGQEIDESREEQGDEGIKGCCVVQ